MNVCLGILKEQIKNFKENYFELVGGCNNMLELSNYTVMDEKYVDKKYFKECKKVNDKLKMMYSYLIEIKGKIEEL